MKTIKKRHIVGDCGDCGQPIYNDGYHDPLCVKPALRRHLWRDSDDYRPGEVYASGSWFHNRGSSNE